MTENHRSEGAKMTLDKVREVLEEIKDDYVPMDNGGYFKLTNPQREAICKAIEALKAIEQAKDELPEKLNLEVVANNITALTRGRGYNDALRKATPILAKKVLENAELQKIVDRITPERISEILEDMWFKEQGQEPNTFYDIARAIVKAIKGEK